MKFMWFVFLLLSSRVFYWKYCGFEGKNIKQNKIKKLFDWEIEIWIEKLNLVNKYPKSSCKELKYAAWLQVRD